MTSRIAALALLAAASLATGQTPVDALPAPNLPNAPKPTAPPEPIQAYEGIVAGTFCGIGASSSSVSIKPTVGCGLGIDLLMVPFFFVEFGVMAPQANRSYLTGYISFDAEIPLRHYRSKYLPVLIGGYSRLFETGHALDCGIALAVPRKPVYGEGRSLQIELRDYYTFANSTQHNIMLRVGWLTGVSD